jgi:hypothetical protein
LDWNANRRNTMKRIMCSIAAAIAVSAVAAVTVRAEEWREIAVVPSDEARFGPAHVYVSDVHEQTLPGVGGRQIKFHMLVKTKGADSFDVVEVLWCETKTVKMLEAHLANGMTTYPSGDFKPIDRVYARPDWEAFKALCR